jgi:hypothetical protein
LLEKLVEQDAAAPLATVRGRYMGMADQSHVIDRLDAHDADQDAICLNTREPDAMVNFLFQLFQRHVRFLPAVGGNHAPVCLSGVIDDLEHPFQIVGAAESN